MFNAPEGSHTVDRQRQGGERNTLAAERNGGSAVAERVCRHGASAALSSTRFLQQAYCACLGGVVSLQSPPTGCWYALRGT